MGKAEKTQGARPSNDVKPFHIGDILSITTGRMVSPRHMEGIYDILNYMTGDNLFTHQLRRAADACKPALLEQHPILVEWGERLVFELDKSVYKDVPKKFDLLPFALEIGCSDMDVVPLAEWERRNPIEELVGMVGEKKVSVVEISEGVEKS